MFRRDKAIPYDYVIIPPEGGKVTVDLKDQPDAAETWVKAVIEQGFKSVSDIAGAAKAIAGSDRVAVQPA